MSTKYPSNCVVYCLSLISGEVTTYLYLNKMNSKKNYHSLTTITINDNVVHNSKLTVSH